MTIVEAVKSVLSSSVAGMTSWEVYQEIIAGNYIPFPLKSPTQL